MTHLIYDSGWYMPARETHFQEYFAKSRTTEYQQRQRDNAIVNCRDYRTVVDVGGNIGTWSRPFADVFHTVIAFEPQPDCRDAFEENLEGYSNVTLYPYALGRTEGMVDFYYVEETCGNAGINAQGVIDGPTGSTLQHTDLKKYTVEQRTLDSFKLRDVDLIKIDVQGAEEQVLMGAYKTIEINQPLLCLELPTRTRAEQQTKQGIKLMLESWGYRETGAVAKDTLFEYHGHR